MDLAGNRINDITTTDNTSVLVDRDAPAISNLSLVTSNSNDSFAKAGDNLTLRFTTSEVVRNLG